MVHRLFSQLKKSKTQIQSILLVKDNQLVLEEYFGGQSPSQPHDLRSTTKSIKSLLLGIALDKGFINSVKDPVLIYLKTAAPQKHLDERKEKISIEHLLTMSSGLDCNDWDKKSKGQEDRVYKKEDWIQYTLDLPMINDPGKVSHYCSMGSLLIAEIISQTSGLSIQEFAQKFLFDPLGIQNINWGHTSDKEVIPSGKRLYITSRDMAKIGQLVLNQGKWEGKQIVSQKWIQESTTPKTKITGIDYGYLWWNLPFSHQGKTLIAKTATGNGGQYIIVFPELEMVIVFTGEAYNSADDKIPFTIVQKIFLPTFLKENKN
ncbi:MAG: serine hydrolase [Bacteroidota bacterium]